MSRSIRVVVSELRPGRYVLGEEQSRYVVKVHRRTVGDVLELFDPEQGLLALRAVIISDRLPQVTVEVDAITSAPCYDMPLTLLLGVTKHDKPEQAVRDATAFGADEVVLVQSERSVPRALGAGRADRWGRVAAQVARQCERGRLPRITGPMGFSQMLAERPEGEARFVCAFSESAVPLLAALSRWAAPTRAAIYVGPEGGVSEQELAAASALGFVPVSLGPYVLRSETAATAVLAVARAVWLAQGPHAEPTGA